MITQIDGAPVRGAIAVINAINAKNGNEVALTVVRERKIGTVTAVSQIGIK